MVSDAATAAGPVAAGDPFEGAVLRRTPRQARSRQKVTLALAAAERLLEREGASALTVTRVAREAGVSVGALHQYLPDREAMTRALLTRYHARFERLLESLAERAEADDPADDPANDPVTSVLAAFADLHRASAGVRALRGQQPDLDAETAAHKVRMTALLEQLLRGRGLLKGLAPDRAARVARTAFAVADALMHEAFRDDPGGDAAMLEELSALLTAYLRWGPADGDGGSRGPTTERAERTHDRGPGGRRRR